MELLQDESHLGAEPGFILSLHTWGRSLALHPHLHCLITEGGLTASSHWQSPKHQGFLPARVLMSKFRGKFIAGLRKAIEREQVCLPVDPSPRRFDNLLNKLGRKKWNVNLRQCYPHGRGVATYLARYVRGGPLHNTQIRGLTDTQVCYRYYAHPDNPDGRQINPTELWVSIEEFIRRYLQHVSEPSRQRVRSYGLYARGKAHRLNYTRGLFDQPAVEPPPFLDWQTYCINLTGCAAAFTCSTCGARIRLVQPVPRQHDPPRAKEAPHRH